MTGNDIFDELFVLEMANNHLGNVQRGLKIVSNYAQVVRFNNVRAAIKLQLRDVDSFIHQDFRHRHDIRYVKKTLETRLQAEDFAKLVRAIREASCIPMATPFDESSVDFCCELGIPILKIASSDCNDWVLIEKIAKTKKPVIVSTGGTSLKDIDDLVTFFDNRHIPLAINHCVSIYPSEDCDIELNQIDFLRNRYPNHIIGFSTHEYRDWTSSMLMAYAKGARTFERHVDVQTDGMTVSPYCSVPEQIDTWFKAFHRAKRMCGSSRHSETPAAAKRNRLSRRARSRSLCPARSCSRPRFAGGRRLSCHSTSAGADFLPRTDAWRSHPQSRTRRSAHHDRLYRQPLCQHPFAH